MAVWFYFVRLRVNSCRVRLPLKRPFNMALNISQNSSNDFALVGGTIYVGPWEESIPDGVVLIKEGKIAQVGDRAQVLIPLMAQTLDCSGLWMTAGLWNSHVHFFERKWAEA